MYQKNGDWLDGGWLQCFGVLEYIQGRSLMGLEGQRALAHPNEAFLHELGLLLVLDVLINNFDRIPLPIWQNDGNLSNVMVTASGHIVGIDQQVNVIVPGAGREQYLEKVRSLVRCIWEGGGVEAASVIKQLCTAFDENCAATLSESSYGALLQGMREGFMRVIRARENGMLSASLQRGRSECDASFGHMYPNCVHPDMQLGQLDDMCAFIGVVAEQIAVVITKVTEEEGEKEEEKGKQCTG